MLVKNDYEELIAKATQLAIASGTKVLQIHWLAINEVDHCAKLLEILNPPFGAVVADMVAGVGEVARLMRLERPDLQFLLVNNNHWHTEN